MQTLDLVVPFTTPTLTRAAIGAAERFSSGLSAGIRLLRIQVVPYPEDMSCPAIRVPYVRSQMAKFRSAIPMRTEVVLARDYEKELEDRLTFESVVVLASPHRYWFTKTWLLARRLRRDGYRVVMVYPDKHEENNIA